MKWALSLAAILAAAPAAPRADGLSLLEAEHLRSREARERLAGGDGAAALSAYQALEEELGARPEIAAGRGAALLQLGRGGEARDSFARARQAPEPVGSRALLGMGNALAAGGDLDGAAGAYREALARDPGYADARHNREVALRRKQQAGPPKPDQARQPAPASGGPRDRGGGAEGAGQKEGARAPDARGDQGAAPARPEPAQPGSAAPRPAEREGRSAAERAGPGGDGGARPDGRLSPAQAERLLDALRSRERNLPLTTARQREARRGDAKKDW